MEVLSLNRDSLNFPTKLLSDLIKPPIQRIWYRGLWRPEILTRCAAVVGSRRMSRYGRQVVEEVVPRLCTAGYTIVSGLMYGIDQLSHRITLDCGGKAIAVLGYGITNMNDETAYSMEEEIEQSGGLVISEYEGESVSQRWMFPQRNRIVVGLSDIIIVVEAGLKSGSLGTAKLAQKFGKKVYAVPGPIFSPVSEGTNSIIANGQAKMLTLDTLTEIAGLDAAASRRENRMTRLNASEREICNILKIDGPQSCNEIARALNTPAREILTLLSQLDMKSVVGEERGIWRVV